MVPPQLELLQSYGGKIAPDYGIFNNNNNNTSLHRHDNDNANNNRSDILGMDNGAARLSLKSHEQLYAKYFNNSGGATTTAAGIDIAYAESRESVLKAGNIPSELDLRENGVFAKRNIGKRTRYGPFQGKWAGYPQDRRFAWEVRENFAFLLLV